MTYVKLLLLLLRAFEAIARAWRDNKLISAGEAKAIAEGMRRSADALAIARNIEAEAETAHRQDPTDSAFDPDLLRKDE